MVDYLTWSWGILHANKDEIKSPNPLLNGKTILSYNKRFIFIGLMGSLAWLEKHMTGRKTHDLDKQKYLHTILMEVIY